MSWFKQLQRGIKDVVDKTKEAGDRVQKIAEQALEKTKVAMLANLPQSLVTATETGELDTLRKALVTYENTNPGVNAMTLTNKDGKTLLHFASESGPPEMVKFLLDAKVCLCVRSVVVYFALRMQPF